MPKIAAIALTCLIALPLTAQPKVLVTKSRVVYPVASDGNFAFPATCDGQGHLYVKLVKSKMKGPLLKLSSSGKLEAEFDTEGALVNIYAVRPNGGVAMVHLDNGTTVIDNFDSNGRRESEIRLDRSPVPFFPTQLAVFPSGEILVAGLQGHPSYKASTAVYDARGHLVKQFALDGDAEIEHAIEIGDARYTRAAGQDNEAVSRSVATTGDDGLVYLMRAMSPAIVYAIPASGDVVRKIAVPGPTEAGLPDFSLRVAKNRLAVGFFRSCDTAVDIGSCQGAVYSVADATTGEKLADYLAENESAGPFACYSPDPDRFFTFWAPSEANRLEVIEAGAK